MYILSNLMFVFIWGNGFLDITNKLTIENMRSTHIKRIPSSIPCHLYQEANSEHICIIYIHIYMYISKYIHKPLFGYQRT